MKEKKDLSEKVRRRRERDPLPSSFFIQTQIPLSCLLFFHPKKVSESLTHATILRLSSALPTLMSNSSRDTSNWIKNLVTHLMHKFEKLGDIVLFQESPSLLRLLSLSPKSSLWMDTAEMSDFLSSLSLSPSPSLSPPSTHHSCELDVYVRSEGFAILRVIAAALSLASPAIRTVALQVRSEIILQERKSVRVCLNEWGGGRGRVYVFPTDNCFIFDNYLFTFIGIQTRNIQGELRVPTSTLLLYTTSPSPSPSPSLPSSPSPSPSPSPSLSPSPFVTTHCENGFLFSLDVSRIMFSSGNGTERKRMALMERRKEERGEGEEKRVEKEKEEERRELVVDMFAGIGYFTVPYVASKVKKVREMEKQQKRKQKRRVESELMKEKKVVDLSLSSASPSRSSPSSPSSSHSSLSSSPSPYPSFSSNTSLSHSSPLFIPHLIAIEKNPDSFAFLQRNLHLNSIDEHVTPILGDNREVGREWEGTADRVFMGFYPNTEIFLPRALQFLNRTRGGVLHYHHLCTKAEYRVMATRHVCDALIGIHDKSDMQVCDDDTNDMHGDHVPFSQLLACRPEDYFRLEEFVVVKSYSPHVYHCVADVRIFPSSFPSG